MMRASVGGEEGVLAMAAPTQLLQVRDIAEGDNEGESVHLNVDYNKPRDFLNINHRTKSKSGLYVIALYVVNKKIVF